MAWFRIIQADITTLKVDAIVNAANQSLLGGGGVDGAIHRAAGPELLNECRSIGGCPTGEARLTRAYLLPARFIIHTVGPVWRGGEHGEAQLLQACYRSSLTIAIQKGICTVAFPCISTGVYAYPKEKAAETALKTALQFVNEHPGCCLTEVTFACFSKQDLEIYQKTASALDML